MKRQEKLAISSPSRRENKNAPQNLYVGCMSGFIHLLSHSHTSRRLITFGKKLSHRGFSTIQPKDSTRPSSSPVKKSETKEATGSSTALNRRLSSEMPRSPTLPAEIRRSNSVHSPGNFRTPPAIITRLIGLEDSPVPNYVPPIPGSAAEKKKRLLQALQKCDDDLETLRKIIESLRSPEKLRKPSPEVPKGGGFRGNMIKTVFETEITYSELKGDQQPSPVSVLDEFTRSPNRLSSSSSKRHPYGTLRSQQKQQLPKKPGEEELISHTCFYDWVTAESNAIYSKGRKDEALGRWNRKAMDLKGCVEEVCKDISWGEKRELGRIGLALQDHICRDLIEEVVKEFRCGHNYFYPLPFNACKRRLYF